MPYSGEMKHTAQLGDVQETLLIPLYGRALDARRRDSMLHDGRADGLVASIDYDFAKFSGPSLGGSVLRSTIFDGYVRAFLDEHPDGTVVDLGCGLNTRFDRLDNGRVRWFDIDLPDTMALRRRFFEDTDRYTMIDGSILETDWFDTVRAGGGPTFLVSEAVLMYFDAETVHRTLRQIAGGFPVTRFAFDTGGRIMMDSQERNPVFRALTARMKWTCDHPGEIEECGFRLLDSRDFSRPQPEVASTWRPGLRAVMRTMGALRVPMVTTYRMNLFESVGR